MYLQIFENSKFYNQIHLSSKQDVEKAKQYFRAEMHKADNFKLDGFTFELVEVSEYVGGWHYEYSLYRALHESMLVRATDLDDHSVLLWEGTLADWKEKVDQDCKFENGYNLQTPTSNGEYLTIGHSEI